MKVLLSGATAGTNFGDFLFAKMFQEYVGTIVGEENVYWNDKGYHPISEFYASRLNYHRKFRLRDIDTLVYISGGYFCGDDRRLLDYVFRYLRYFHIGIRCLIRRKPVAIIAVEAAKSNSFIIDKIQRLLIRKAKLIVVRNQPSMEYVESVVGKDSVKTFCTADSVFAMERNFFENAQIPGELNERSHPKLFLHCNPVLAQNQKHFEKIIPIVNNFLAKHPEYQVVVSADQYVSDFTNAGGTGELIKSQIQSDNVIIYKYDDPVALCKVIDSCDIVVTHKLHVGIVAAHLGKSVISFSGHTQKIERLYEQLEISDRTIPLSTLTIEEGTSLLEAKYNSGVKVPENVVNAAKSNFTHLANFLSELGKL